jgi:putative selenate reductase
MEKKFQPAPIELLGRWIFTGLARDEVMGFPRAAVTFPDARMQSVCLGRKLGAPLGVAAGPHTQLAANVVSAWLFGARFIELKTVQILDEISVSRPCIDAADVTYNCEWSQELTLEQSFDEYLKAWVLLHALAHHFDRQPDFVFNMSVGYDLDGIRSDKVQRFLRRMRDASEDLPRVVDELAPIYPAVRDIAIPTELSSLLTLSTMHGCPPAEIERIAKFMIADLGLNTWVKLNPTLLGPALLRGILNDRMGYDVVVEDAAFDHDPKFDDAMQMVRHLVEAASSAGVSFGVKLSNTLEVANRRPVFPPNEKSMYMSGRALHPLTVTLAHKVTEALDGKVPLSFCGGADAFNFASLVADGLSPVTTCTDLLKPGGYARLSQYVERLAAELDATGATSLDEYVVRCAQGTAGSVAACARANLARHAERVVADPGLRHRVKPMETKGERPLGAFDCISAPCQEACPTHQDIPAYMRWVAQDRAARALDVILHTNAMPAVTGRVCDHPCQERCVRNHFDGPLAIRSIKRHAVATGGARSDPTQPTKSRASVAIIGAGPAGLSAGYYLRQAGIAAMVFEAKAAAGGMVSAVIPSYRLPNEPIDDDLRRILGAGVALESGVRVGETFPFEALRGRGFGYVVIAAGAQAGRKLGIDGEDGEGVYDAIAFLDAVRNGEPPRIGPRVLVIGGGNSAMDAARTAQRLVPADGSVTVVYRRTLAQMPADAEELEACLEEGVRLQPLRAPVRVERRDGRVTGLACVHMTLGELDTSGRPRPVPVEGSESSIACDTILVGISQEPLLGFLDDLGLKRWKDGTIKVDPATCETNVPNLFAGGDVARGPATVIKAVADGRRIAETIAFREGLSLADAPEGPERLTRRALLERRSRRQRPVPVPALPMDARRGFAEVLAAYEPGDARVEADRCLDCSEMCSLCVTVCPNRANQMYGVRPRRVELPTFVVQGGALVVDGTRAFAITQPYQIVNLADFCNECGNCTTFCPTAGAPYRDKPRVYLDKLAFGAAGHDAFFLERTSAGMRVEARVGGLLHALELDKEQAVYRGAGVVVVLDAASWAFVEAEPTQALADDTTIDLTLAATMMVLVEALESVPA